jgi:hypothetical protein
MFADCDHCPKLSLKVLDQPTKEAALAEGIPSQTTGLEVGTCWEENVGREMNTHLQEEVSVDGQRQDILIFIYLVNY